MSVLGLTTGTIINSGRITTQNLSVGAITSTTNINCGGTLNVSGGCIIRGSGSNFIRLHSYVDITGYTVLGGGAQTPSLLVDTVKNQNSSPYNDSIYLTLIELK
jgi:hypothetical protein